MVNQRQEEIPPLVEYTPALVEPVDMARDGVEGYILFPRSLGTSCNPTVNILEDLY